MGPLRLLYSRMGQRWSAVVGLMARRGPRMLGSTATKTTGIVLCLRDVDPPMIETETSLLNVSGIDLVQFSENWKK